MIKTAIFVEGQTELIFVREMVLKMFGYENVSLECYTLFTDSNFNTTEYAFPNSEAGYFFQIINVGNDTSVLTRMLRRQQRLFSSGFSKIIGLRDMYSREYRKHSSGATIDQELNKRFISAHRKQITAENVFFTFAIMEIEAWILGFRRIYETLGADFTTEYVKNAIGYDMITGDPETEFYHPAEQLSMLLQLASKKYSKSKSDVNSLVSSIQKEDYIDLFNSGKCNSFREFCSLLSLAELN